ncbi:putative bifunctional diguanylate cyclase/phosphodiesterase [Pontixanthobacter sp.]|uniref:putative bifunctional diguanylate cyclase/phosphodiesterase n=1 Tax=Pontixanthobacter sp. TaxID=2792078 RepID=UPI003C7CCB76
MMTLRKLVMPPAMIVILPLLVLSVIFAIVIGTSFFADDLSGPGVTSLLVGGISIYAAAVGLLCKIGFASIGRLEMLGLTDSLSMLPNRRALHKKVRAIVHHDGEIAIALIDLDGFKMVNDLYGHAVGDDVIKEAAAILTNLCQDDAQCFRLGGDEFAIIMTGPLSSTILEGICRRLIDRLRHPIEIADRRIAIGASVGLALSKDRQNPHHTLLTSSELLRRADVAMYASKRGGRMRCTWFKSEFDRNLEAIRTLDEELRHALRNDEFQVHYQPLVDAQTKAIVAVESLIRWHRPDGKMIGPALFIPVAEKSGLIHAIGLLVLRQSCQDALQWRGIKLSVNISAAQLRDPAFPVQLGQILEDTGFPPELLELEITETCLVLDPIVAERSLDVIRGFGVRVVLDDFGTGYASIGFLRQFRFEKLKLDRSLIVGSADDEGSRAMMLSSISMAQALKMDVTAEGVETEAQADLVRAAGCDQIQGWLYFKAMPADQIARHLAHHPAPGAAPDLPGHTSEKAAS